VNFVWTLEKILGRGNQPQEWGIPPYLHVKYMGCMYLGVHLPEPTPKSMAGACSGIPT
jgi:hypothetical protein